jgi:hypothetical protein
VFLYDALQRRFWKLARLITGQNGKTKGAVVRVSAKNGFSRVHYLEIKCKGQHEQESESTEQRTEHQVTYMYCMHKVTSCSRNPGEHLYNMNLRTLIDCHCYSGQRGECKEVNMPLVVM